MTTEHLLYGETTPRPVQGVNTMSIGEASLVTGYATHAIADLRKKGKLMCPADPQRVYIAWYIGEKNTRAFGLLRAESIGDMPTTE